MQRKSFIWCVAVSFFLSVPLPFPLCHWFHDVHQSRIPLETSLEHSFDPPRNTAAQIHLMITSQFPRSHQWHSLTHSCLQAVDSWVFYGCSYSNNDVVALPLTRQRQTNRRQSMSRRNAWTSITFVWSNGTMDRLHTRTFDQNNNASTRRSDCGTVRSRPQAKQFGEEHETKSKTFQFSWIELNGQYIKFVCKMHCITPLNLCISDRFQRIIRLRQLFPNILVAQK